MSTSPVVRPLARAVDAATRPPKAIAAPTPPAVFSSAARFMPAWVAVSLMASPLSMTLTIGESSASLRERFGERDGGHIGGRYAPAGGAPPAGSHGGRGHAALPGRDDVRRLGQHR